MRRAARRRDSGPGLPRRVVTLGAAAAVLVAGLVVSTQSFAGTGGGFMGFGSGGGAASSRLGGGGLPGLGDGGGGLPGLGGRGDGGGGLPGLGGRGDGGGGLPGLGGRGDGGASFPGLGGGGLPGRGGDASEDGGGNDAGSGNDADGGNDAGGGNGETGGCADVHIIATRASTEQPGAGIIGSLVSAVQDGSSQSVSTDATDYPATLVNYPNSVAQGVAALNDQITTQAQNCPDSQIVLMGYSQGAHVIGDVLAGGGGRLGGGQTPALDADSAAKVSAVILMGDPTHVPGKSFNAGTSEKAGLFPRGDDASLDPFAEDIQSYCDTGDTFCDRGANVAVHLGYTRKYNAQAEEFVLDRIGG